MTLCGENRKWLISSLSFDAPLALFGRVKPGVPATVSQGAKAGSEILSPQATAGPAYGSRGLWAPGKGHKWISCPAAPRADSWGIRADSSCTSSSWAVLMEKQRVLQIQHLSKDRGVSSGWGMTSATEKHRLWIASRFAKYQVCVSERCLTQAT